MVWKQNWCSLCCRKQRIPSEALPGSRRPWWLSSCWNRLPGRQYPQKKGNWNREFKKKKNHINITRWKSCWTWGWSCAFCQNKMYRLKQQTEKKKKGFLLLSKSCNPCRSIFFLHNYLFLIHPGCLSTVKSTTQTLLNWYISTNRGHSFPRLPLNHINKNQGGQKTNFERECRKKAKARKFVPRKQMDSLLPLNMATSY